MQNRQPDKQDTSGGKPNEPNWYNQKYLDSPPESNSDLQENEQAQPESDTQSPEDLERAESNPKNPQKEAGTEREKSLLDSAQDQVGGGFKHEGGGPSGLDSLRDRVRGSITRKKALAGGGIGGLIAAIIFLMLFGGSFEMIHLRENMLGQANKYVNSALERRRNTNFYQIVKKLNKGDLTGKIDNAKFANKMRAQGFIVEFQDGKLSKFGYETDIGGGKQTKFLDLEATNSKRALNAFLDDGEFGSKASRSLDIAVGGRAATWKGKAARKLYGSMNLRFSNWLDRKASDKAETDRQRLADNLRHADELDAEIGRRISATDPRDADNDGKIDPDKNGSLLGDAENALGEAEDYRQRLLENPQDTGVIEGVNDDLIGAVDGVGGSLDDLVSTGAGSKALGEAAIKGLSPISYFQTACTVNGTVKFLANVQNIALSYQLAKFSMRFMSAADNQKAGVLSGDGLKLMMLYLNTKSPSTGRSALQSGGIRSTILGDSSARPSAVNLGKYNTGRASNGILSDANNYISGVLDRAGGPRACSVANNGFVQIGALVVGVGAAIFTGGTSAAASITLNVTVGIVGEVVKSIAVAQATKSVAGMVMNGYEDGEQVGDALASGWGTMRGMNANANGLRPATKAEIALLDQQINSSRAFTNGEQGIFERYFSTSNGNSALVSIGATTSSHLSISNATGRFFSSITRLPNLFAQFFFVRGAYAAEDECKDPQVKRLNLEADAFCSLEIAATPDLDVSKTEEKLRELNLIDTEGAPVPGTDYAAYVEYCFSGRPALLYDPNIDMDKNDELVAKMGACTLSGKNENGGILPGDTEGKYDRYANWYGYMVDEDNLAEEINDDFNDAEAAIKTPTTPANPGNGGNWVWPIKDVKAIRDGPCWAGSSQHAGMDINSSRNDTVAYAMHNGTVVAANTNYRENVSSQTGPPEGNYVMVKVNDKLYYNYQHLQPGLRVSVGQQVVAGVTEIGLVGKTGNVSLGSSVAHLHIGISKSADPGSYGNIGGTMNPLDYLPKPAPGGYKCT